jgi:hypothetical protein
VRRVSGNPAKRHQRAGKNQASKRQLFRRPRFLPSTRAGQRLALLSTWVVLTSIAVPAGWNAGRIADSQYVFIMTSITLPVGLAGLLGAWYFALAAIGGASKIRRLDVPGWPTRRRRFAAATVGVAAAVALTNLIQWVHADLPAGLIVAAALAAGGATFDVVQVLRARRR